METSSRTTFPFKPHLIFLNDFLDPSPTHVSTFDPLFIRPRAHSSNNEKLINESENGN